MVRRADPTEQTMKRSLLLIAFNRVGPEADEPISSTVVSAYTSFCRSSTYALAAMAGGGTVGGLSLIPLAEDAGPPPSEDDALDC